MARTFTDIKGLPVTNTQAREIKELYDNLLPFDKKPLSFVPQPLKPVRGRFARSKYRVGNTGADHVKFDPSPVAISLEGLFQRFI